VTTDPERPGAADVVFDAPPGWHAAEVAVEVELSVRTPAGIDISPAVLSRKVAVTTPLTVTPRTLSLPATNRGQTVPARLVVTAGDDRGCVWVDTSAARLTVPRAEVEVTSRHSSAADCVGVDAGQRREVPLDLEVERGCGCRVRGVLPVVLEVGGSSIPVDVEFDFPTQTDGTRLGVALAVLALLALAPLVLLLLVNRWLARFHSPRMLRYARVDVIVTPDGVRARDGGADWPDPDDVHLPAKPPRSTLSIGHVTFRARSSWWNPFARPRTTISTTRDRVLAIPDGGGRRTLDHLPLDLTDQIVVVAETGRDPRQFAAEVVIVLGADRSIVDGHAQRIRDRAATAARHLRLSAAAPPGDPTESRYPIGAYDPTDT
jgi:hypothetical protein